MDNNMQAFLIKEFDLIGVKLYTHKLLPFDNITRIEKDRDIIRMVAGNMAGEYVQYTRNNYYSLLMIPKGYNEETTKFLPYTANVTEDLPSSCKGLKPKVYKNCQLMTEKHGGYLQFWHNRTKSILRIAINSHTYTPTN